MPLPPIRREVIVAADPERAFLVFTDEISGWWPLERLSVLGPGSLVSFEGDRLVERTVDGSEAVWGEVHVWEPGRRLSFSWHPGRDIVTEVTVTFTATEAGTHVVLEHDGWEAYADPAARRAEYEQGWPSVLELYRNSVGATADETAKPGETWVALMHTPGPSAPADGSVFDDPRFGEHVAFLARMSERGYLVAAGPLGGEDGSGMTILRLSGEDRLAEVTELATVDDLAVAGGLFAVHVQPWNVVFHSLA